MSSCLLGPRLRRQALKEGQSVDGLESPKPGAPTAQARSERRRPATRGVGPRLAAPGSIRGAEGMGNRGNGVPACGIDGLVGRGLGKPGNVVPSRGQTAFPARQAVRCGPASRSAAPSNGAGFSPV